MKSPIPSPVIGNLIYSPEMAAFFILMGVAIVLLGALFVWRTLPPLGRRALGLSAFTTASLLVAVVVVAPSGLFSVIVTWQKELQYVAFPWMATGFILTIVIGGSLSMLVCGLDFIRTFCRSKPTHRNA